VNHDGRVGIGHLPDLVKDLLHRSAVFNDIGNLTGVRQLTAEAAIFKLQLIVFAGLAYLLPNEIQVQRFRNEIEGSSTYRLNGRFHTVPCAVMTITAV